MNIRFDQRDTTPIAITQEFKEAIFQWPETCSLICQKTGMNVGRLSRILNGREFPSRGDRRLIAIANYINFPENQIFKN